MLKHTIVIKPGYPIKVFFDSRKKVCVPVSVVGCYQVTACGLWANALPFPTYCGIFFPKVILKSPRHCSSTKHGETFP